MSKALNLILGSGSPRRQSLLEGMLVPFEKRVIPVDEVYSADLQPFEIAPYLSKLKAEAHASTLRSDEVVLTADTIVVLKNKVLEKPKDRAEAIEMLQRLSNETHTVMTAVHLFGNEGEIDIAFQDQALVTFGPLSDSLIEKYVNAYQPFDKAGAYGIQEFIGYVAIDKIEGSFYTVMGLPTAQVHKQLTKLGII